MSELTKFGIQRGDGKYHQEMVYTLALLYNVLSNKMESYFAPFGFSIGKFNTLVAIRHHGGESGIKQVEVSDHLIVTPSNMTKMIDKLSKEGFVTRSALEGDRRVKILKITSKGEKVLDKIWPGYLEVLQAVTSELSQSKQKELANLLGDWLVKVR